MVGMSLKEICSKIKANDESSSRYKSFLIKQSQRRGAVLGKGDIDYGVEVFVVRLMDTFILVIDKLWK